MAAYTKYKPPYIANGKNAAELIFLQKLANTIFYFRPSVILSYIKRIKSFNDFKYFLKSFLKFLLGSI